MTQIITALKAQKGNNQRINVHLDGEFAFGISRIVAAWLEVGQELTPEKIKELKGNEAIESAYQRALNFLSYRPRSQAEVIRNLRKHNTPEDQIEIVLERLLTNKLVDDENFAQLWVENRSDFRPRGAYKLRMELRQKGISESIIDEAIDGIEEDKLAYQAARKRAERFKDLAWVDFRKKLSGFLSRRGFRYEIISNTISKVWEELRDEKEASEVLK
jgi:regulatory protein